MTDAPRLRAVVVGSGFGGLAAAIRLQATGYDTTVVEKRDKPGGRAYVYEQDGFSFDAGPTVITAPHCLEELFELAGRRMEDYVDLVPVRPFYRLLWDDGFSFDYDDDLEGTLEQIRAVAPDDADGYLRFLDYSRRVFDAGYTDLVHVPFLDLRSMVRVAPQLMRLQAYRSVHAQVAKHVQEPHLRQAFSFHSLLIGGNPFAASSIYTLIPHLERKWGVHFPVGGTAALVRALVGLFEDLGGTVRLEAPVQRIVTEAGRVRGVELPGGERLDADVVVSNADIVHTYDALLQDEPAAAPEARRLQRMRHSPSLFVLYFGTDRTYPDVAHHTVLFGPRYQELLADIYERGHLADDFSLYLHAPTRTDPGLAPEGHEAFYVLSPVPNLLAGDVDWEVEGPRYAERILEYLETRCLPGLRDHIVTKRLFTPSDFASELNAHGGSAFSLEPTLRQSAYFRSPNRARRVDGLYVVGAGTHPGAGVPGVVNSAKATVSVVLEDQERRRAKETKEARGAQGTREVRA